MLYFKMSSLWKKKSYAYISSMYQYADVIYII